MRLANDLNPSALRRPQAKNKVCSDKDFVRAILDESAKSFSAIIKEANTHLKMSRRTTMNYLKRLVDNGIIVHSSGLYWKKEGQADHEN